MGAPVRNVNENDRRVKRTKRALKEALFKILETKPFNQISVTELTEMADINRATFYFYYDDACDMILKLQEEVYKEFELIILRNEPLDSVADLKYYLLSILDFCKKNAEMCKFLLTSDTATVHYRKIVKIIARNAPNTAKLYPETSAKRYLTTYAVYSIIGVIAAWLTEGMKISEEELAETLVKIYRKGSDSVR